MKNILRTLAFCVGLSGMMSCSDFLNQTSPSELDDTTVFNSLNYTELAVNKIYGDLGLDGTYSQYIPIIWGLNSDCELVDGLGTDATNTSSERGNMNYNSNPGWANIATLWTAMYGIIENANIVIEGVDGSSLIQTDDSNKTSMLRFKGEALALRAMIYFDMIRFFGDIPMKMETTKTDLSNVYLGKTDRDVIMDYLIQDLELAIEYLPWAGESGYTTEHVTKGYAHALLANIALSRAGWHIREAVISGYETASFTDAQYPTQRCGSEKRTEMYNLALSHLNALMNSGVHQLNPSVENHWYLINQRTLDQTYRENIFEIPMGLAKTGELGYTVGVRIIGSSSRYGVKGNSSGKLKLTAPYLYSFDANDLRRDLTCATYQLAESNGVLSEEMLGNIPFAIYCAKWDIRKMNEEWRQAAIDAGDAKCMTGINVVRMRYPQVLLMYAEVMNELYGPDGGTGLTAREALKQVHSRAFSSENQTIATRYIEGLPSDRNAFFNAIVDENAWELAGEGFRKFDLIRWNLLSSKIDQFKSDYETQLENEVYPTKLYYKYVNGTNEIDMSSICWYAEPDDTDGYESVNSFGYERTASAQTQLLTNLPSISSGLNASVVNRYLLPIASTTISAASGSLHNSYGFSD